MTPSLKDINEIGWSHVRIGGKVYLLMGYQVIHQANGKKKKNKANIAIKQIRHYDLLKKRWIKEEGSPHHRPLKISVYHTTLLIYCPV